MELLKKIKDKKVKVAVIGVGYVGLPHIVGMVDKGLDVVGIDISKERVDKLNAGKTYISDVTSKDVKRLLKTGKFRATTSYAALKDVDVAIICVPTPLDKYKIPDVSCIMSAASEIKKHLKPGMLICVESTTYPGTTDEVVLPLLEETGLKCGSDFYLCFAPERIDPGNKTAFDDVPKVVGGITKECTKRGKAFYSIFLKKVHPVSSTRAAEMTKILENTYRLVNVSLINEISLLAGKMGIDIWEVIDAAATKPYGYHPFYPGPKIGGHCIPLDPFYLSWKAKEHNFWARFIELAGEINEQKPHYTVVNIIWFLNKHKKPINGSKILVVGASYKKDIGDPREGAVLDIVPNLKRKHAKVDYYDPYIPTLNIYKRKKHYKLKSIKYSLRKLKTYDLVVILTDHSCIDYDELAKNANLVVDTRNAIKSRKYKNVSRI